VSERQRTDREKFVKVRHSLSRSLVQRATEAGDVSRGGSDDESDDPHHKVSLSLLPAPLGLARRHPPLLLPTQSLVRMPLSSEEETTWQVLGDVSGQERRDWEEFVKVRHSLSSLDEGDDPRHKVSLPNDSGLGCLLCAIFDRQWLELETVVTFGTS